MDEEAGMTDRETDLAKHIGTQMNNKILCPQCHILEQELSTFGDNEDRLFCPHCEMEVQITVRLYDE